MLKDVLFITQKVFNEKWTTAQLWPDKSQVGSSHDLLDSAIQPLYLDILEDFKNDPYISIYVKGKLWQ